MTGFAPAGDVLAMASTGHRSVRLFRGVELQSADNINAAMLQVTFDARAGNFVLARAMAAWR